MFGFRKNQLYAEPCIVCNSNSFKHYHTANNYDILRCNKCGLFFIDKIEGVDIENFYEHKYFHNEDDDLVGYRNYAAWYEVSNNNYTRLLELLKKYKKKGSRLLDVGCAMGGFVNIANEMGWQAMGIDPSEYAIKMGRARSRVNIQHCYFEDFNPEEKSYDVITFIGVFEHLANPLKELKKIIGILSPGGILLITTLNAGRFFHIFKFKPPEHLFYFSGPQLNKLLKNTGFMVLKSKPYFRSYSLSEFSYRVNSLLFPWMVKYCESLFRRFPTLDIVARFPTNEMLIIAKKI
jgi:2-polyprenyl-3-methyl-5-hydroxy-6-metoxy-1,4-benzoquinol methylase